MSEPRRPVLLTTQTASFLRPSSPSNSYSNINISNYDYAKYSKSSLIQTRSKSMVSSSSNHSHSSYQESSVLKRSNSFSRTTIAAGTTDSDFASTPPPPTSAQLATDYSSPNNSNNNSALSKTYQKYRSLLLSRKPSTSSLSKSNINKARVTFSSLPDEIVGLIVSFVASNKSFVKTPYNSNKFLKEEHSSSNSKTNGGVSFNLAPIEGGSLLNLNPDTQLRIRRPKEPAKQKVYDKYVNQVLKNYKLSKHYNCYPNKDLVSLLYVSKQLYSLTLPWLYKKIVFHSSYRLAQFITTIRSNNNFGLLVESINLESIDNLFYLTFSNDEQSYLILTEREKNKIEQLINNTPSFDGTFNSIDMSEVSSNKINITEILRNSGKLPICIVRDEHSAAINPLIGNQRVEFGSKAKVLLAGWREWKFRGDVLYHSIIPTVEWVNKKKYSTAPAVIHKSASTGTFLTTDTNGSNGININNNTNNTGRTRSNSLGRSVSGNSNSSNNSSLSYKSNYDSRNLRLKFRKIVSRFTTKKVDTTSLMTKRNTKANSSKPFVIKSSKQDLKLENTINEAINIFKFGQHPVKCKILTKYSSKDIPIGFVLHTLSICENLLEFNMNNVLLASDYKIQYNAIDDYGILQKTPSQVTNTTEINKKSFIDTPHRSSFDSAVNHSKSISENNTYHRKSRSFADFNDSSKKVVNGNDDWIYNRSPSGSSSELTRVNSTPDTKPYSNIKKEIDSAYGVSIYTQFTSIVPRRGSMTSNNDDHFFENNNNESSPETHQKSLEFYKDSFGYSSSCNYKQIQSQFYNFLGVPGSSKSPYNSHFDFENTSRSRSPIFNRQEEKKNVFGRLMKEDDCKSQESIIPSTELNSSSRNNNSSKISGLMVDENVVEGEENTDDDDFNPKINVSERLLKRRDGKKLILPFKNPGKSSLSIELITSNTFNKFPKINRIEEIEEDANEIELNSYVNAFKGYKASRHYNPLKNFDFRFEELENIKSPTSNYFVSHHNPCVNNSKYQFDNNLYLSDVRKINNWSIDQLAKIPNERILLNLSELRNLENVELCSANWLSTTNVKEFVQESRALKFENLKTMNLSNSGMRRDLYWATKGTIKEIKRGINLQENGGEVNTNIVDINNIGRNYSITV